MIYWDIRI